MTNNNFFVMVHNTMISGDYKLTVDELYVYSYLYTKRDYTDEVETSIDTLSTKIKLSSSARYNKDNIKKAIERLSELYIINVEEDGKVLTITFPEYEHITEKGFTKVDYAKVKELSPVELYIYSAVKKWEDNPKTGKARYAYSQWAKMLGCSDKSAFTYVNEAVKKGIIFKQVGKHKANSQQENNIYSVNPEYAPVAEEPQEPVQEPVAEEVKPVVEQQPVVEEVKPEPIQEPVANTVAPTLQELLPHVDLDAVKKELNPEPVKTSVPEFNNSGMFDIEAAMAAEGIDFNN